MNRIINKFLLAGDKFMPEMNLRQPAFTWSACEAFTKNKERIKKRKKKYCKLNKIWVNKGSNFYSWSMKS